MTAGGDSFVKSLKNGGPHRTRTYDPLIKSVLPLGSEAGVLPPEQVIRAKIALSQINALAGRWQRRAAHG